MIELVCADEMRRIEQHIIQDVKVPAIVLMERAALFTAAKIQQIFGGQTAMRVLIACGMGNNGADGLALARILAERNYYVTIVMVGNEEKRTELNALQYSIYQKISLPGQVTEITLPQLMERTQKNDAAYDVIVDAILGIGVSRRLEGDFAKLVVCLNQLSGYKLAMDIPTGIHTDNGMALGTYFVADATTTFGRVKTGLLLQDGRLASGDIWLDSCGMYDPNSYGADFSRKEKSNTFIWEKEDLSGLLVRNPNGNKGSFGKLAMLVGSEAVPGAMLLSVGAAFRSGAGYMQLYTHEKNRSLLMEQYPEAVLKLYSDEKQLLSRLDEMLAFADVVTIGCGLGVDTAQTILEKLTTEYVKHLADVKALVLDADALTAIARSDKINQAVMEKLPCDVILTPHLKEFERISGIPMAQVKENRIAIAKSFARQWNVILVLKDAQTIVASPDGNVMISNHGNSGMAVAGSGDVLCGVISAMAGQIENTFSAACVGVMIHACAGDKAAQEMGTHGMLPQDMILVLPQIIISETLRD